jgi:hypothetical protein
MYRPPFTTTGSLEMLVQVVGELQRLRSKLPLTQIGR